MMRRILLTCAIAFSGAGGLAGEDQPATGPSGLDELVAQLGHADYDVREAATRKLEALGPDALEALEKAARHADPEVRTRAKKLYDALVHPTAEQIRQLQEAREQALTQGDHQRIIDVGKRLTLAKPEEPDHWLWLGHGYQLAGRWKQCVEAYQMALRRIDQQAAEPPPLPPAPAPPLGPEVIIKAAAEAAAPVRRIGPVPGLPVIDPRRRKRLLAQRTALALWIARIQAGELGDAKAAIATLSEAVSHFDEIADDTTARYACAMVLRELARLQLQAGDLEGYLATWKLAEELPEAVRDYVEPDIERIGQIIARMPPGKPLPKVPFLFMLTPEAPAVTLKPDDPNTRRQSYQPSQYAFVPPPGKEFDTIAFACDMEQLDVRYGGRFQCFVAGEGGPNATRKLGDIGWPKGAGPGRAVRRGSIKIPPGARVVYVQTGSSKGHLNVHSVQVRATFRAASEKPEPILADASIQTELWPKGGTFTYGSNTLGNREARHGIRPEEYRLRYAVPGRADTFECDFLLAPGRRYHVFVNLDSPFACSQARLDMSDDVSSGRQCSLVRLPDGDYLAVWCGPDSKIMIARSPDLRRWSPPKPAAFNSVFNNVSPSTFADADGTIHLALFSKRLSLLDTSTAGYRLFLTSTRDGKRFSPLRSVAIKLVDGWPMGRLHMLRGPDGRRWIFWRHYAGSGESFDQIRRLEPILPRASEPGDVHLWNPYVALDAAGTFHMVFDSFGDGIYYSRSKDGAAWTAPTAVIPPDGKGNTRCPQLILANGRALLIYNCGAAYLRPIRLDGPAAAAREVKIAWYGCSKLMRTDDGEVLMLTEAPTPWLLRAKLDDLFGAAAETGTGSAGP